MTNKIQKFGESNTFYYISDSDVNEYSNFKSDTCIIEKTKEDGMTGICLDLGSQTAIIGVCSFNIEHCIVKLKILTMVYTTPHLHVNTDIH